jgi:hypothetical protein
MARSQRHLREVQHLDSAGYDARWRGWAAGKRGLPFGSPDWFEDEAYADMAWVADFNEDRYAITTVELEDIPTASAAELKEKREATFDELFVFTAASTVARTYTDDEGVIKADLDVNEPRFTWINDKRQLRLENAGTNLCESSQEFHSGDWVHEEVTVVINAIAAPDGTLTADKVVESTAVNPGNHRAYNSIGTVAGANSVSVYAKAAGRRKFHMRKPDGNDADYVLFDVISLTATDTETGPEATTTIEDVGNGWVRCSITTTSVVVNSSFVLVCLHNDAGARIYTGDGVSGMYFWGGQFEASAFVTDYIPTAAAAVTRAIETCRFSPVVEAILQRSAFSIIVRGQKQDGVRIVGSNGSTTVIHASNPTEVGAWGNGSYLGAQLGSGTFAGSYGAAVGFDGTGRSLVGNQGTVATNAVPFLEAERTTWYLGRDGSGSPGNGHLDFVCGSPDRLSNATLQELAVAAE